MNHLNEASGGSIGFDKIMDMAAGIISSDAFGSKQSTPEKGGYTYTYSSLAKAASNLKAIFPVLASRNVSVETAQMVTKYIEQVACSLFVSALQQANVSTAKDGIEYLRRYHRNLDDGLGGDPLSGMKGWIDSQLYESSGDSNSLSSKLLQEKLDEETSYIYDYLVESDSNYELSARELNDLMKFMEESSNIQVMDMEFNPISINDFIVNESYDGSTYHVSFKPATLNESNKDKRRAEEAEKAAERYKREAERYKDAKEKAEKAQRSAEAQLAMSRSSDEIERKKFEAEKRKRQIDQWAQDDKDAPLKRQRDELDRKINMQQKSRAEKEYRQRQREKENAAKARASSGSNVSFMSNQDIKKMNDAMPSYITVEFYHREGGQTSEVATRFNIAVKAKLIPVTTEEILRRIMNDNKDGQKFIKLMRVLTGELKPLNTILGLSRVRDDLRSTKRKGAYGDTWNLLATRAKAAKQQIKTGRNNDYSAITTVLISSDDADELFREENFDITDPGNAIHFMQSYNLMAFAIANDATEVLSIIMDDGSKTFSEYTYNMFDRETKDGTYKKLINLMSSTK